MSRHEGVSCDACLKSNFRGRRFKCLICYDYDLCATCYEDNASSSRHLPEHPMQCILTRSDFELYYGGEVLSAEQPQSFTCPYCNKMGLTDATLAEHVSAEHTDTSVEVVCPVCAAVQGGDPNFLTDDFAGHLTLEHRTGQRDLISFLDEPSAIRHGGVRRIPHSGRALGGPRSRRSNMHFSSSGALSTLSPSGRESVDPITELLSHLTSVRRGPQSSQLQQLQMQIQLERQQITAARQQLERLPRRQAHPVVSSSSPAAASLAAAATSSNGAALNGLSGQQQQFGGVANGISISNFSQIPIASSIHAAASGTGVTSATAAIVAANGNVRDLVPGGGGGGQQNAASSSTAVGGGVSAQSSSAAAAAAAANSQSQFLLARFMTNPLDEKAQAQLEVDRADRSQFVQALILSTIANLEAYRTAEEQQQDQQQQLKGGKKRGDDAEESDLEAMLEGGGNCGGGGGGVGEEDEQQTAERALLMNDEDLDNSSNNNNKNTSSSTNNNAVNKKFDGGGGGGVGGNNNPATISDRIPVMSQASSGGTVSKPKPPTATKPVPHQHLPNNHHERGAGRGLASLGGGGGGRPPQSAVRARQQQHQQQQQQQQAQSHNQAGNNNSSGAGPGASGQDSTR